MKKKSEGSKNPKSFKTRENTVTYLKGSCFFGQITGGRNENMFPGFVKYLKEKIG